MVYTPRKTWVDNTNPPGQLPSPGATPILASDLAYIENGIVRAHNAAPFNVLDFGAVGDNVANDTAAIQAAIDAAAPVGGTVDLRKRTYVTTSSLLLPAGTTLRNGTVRCTGTSVSVLRVTGNNVRIVDVSVVGRHSTPTAVADEHAIYAAGTSAAAPLTGLVVERCTVERVGMYGVYLQDVSGFRVSNCVITGTGYTGIGCLSALNGVIDGNRIKDILAGFSGDGYGIHLSRSQEIDSLVTSPRSANIVVRGNVVHGVPWEGIDSHGGERITITDNVVTACKTGIAVVGADGAGSVAKYAPRQVVVANNVVDGQGSGLGAGIVFVGAPGASSSVPAVDYATGVITGNTVRQHGNEADNILGAVYLRNTKGLCVTGNKIEQPAPFGILCYYDNISTVIQGNAVSDVWSNTFSAPGAVATRGPNNTGTLIGNTLVNAGERSGVTYLNTRGFYDSGTGSVFVGNTAAYNYFAAATTPF